MEKTRGFEKISIDQWQTDAMTVELPDFVKGMWTYDEISLPQRSTAHSAGYDVYSAFAFILEPTQDILIPTGFKSYMMLDEVLLFYPRSGLGFKNYIRLANTTGIGDSDYYNNSGNEGHYWVKIRNEGIKVLTISKGQAIAQCIFMKYLLADGDDLNGGNKRVGGFGSTDNGK